MTSNSNQIINASKDIDLRERLIALAAKKGVANPQNWVDSQMHRLVSAEVNGSSLAEVYEYAVGQYVVAKRPGEDPQYVTDTLMEQAIETLRNAESA